MKFRTFVYTVFALLLSCNSGKLRQSPAAPVENPGPADTVTVLLGQLEVKPSDVNALVELCSRHTVRGEYASSLVYGRRLLHMGKTGGDEKALMYGNFYVGQSLLLADGGDSIETYLRSALELALKTGEGEALSKIYNALGIHATGMEMDYRKGIGCFLKAVEYARADNLRQHYMVALCNLATAYYMRSDPAGLKYAEEVRSLGEEYGDEYMLFGGSVICAYMHYMLGEHTKALEYIDRAMPLTDRYNYHTEVFSLYANIIHALGNDAEAERYYRMALERLDTSVVTAAVTTYLNYASYLLESGKGREALPILRKGITLSADNNYASNRYLLYLRTSEALAGLGDYEEALRYFRLYHAETDSIYNLERESSINELRVKYEAERHENELQQNRITLIQEQKKLQISSLLLVMLVVTCGSIYILYRRKNRMYRQIVKQQHEFLKRERKRESDPQYETKTDKDDKAGRDAELFRKVERMMSEEKIYRQNDLTVEKLAERLGTNRTYLSRTINQHAEMSFSGYLNGYRIDEALRRLSDISDDTPIKALAVQLGYNHIQTFYTAFQNAIGMPPSKYREKLMELYRKNEL